MRVKCCVPCRTHMRKYSRINLVGHLRMRLVGGALLQSRFHINSINTEVPQTLLQSSTMETMTMTMEKFSMVIRQSHLLEDALRRVKKRKFSPSRKIVCKDYTVLGRIEK